jgi:hypothetical protein
MLESTESLVQSRGPVGDAGWLEVRATSFTKAIIQDFHNTWEGEGREVASKDLATSLTSIGTDCLLMGGDVNEEGKLKMAAAIAIMVHHVENDFEMLGDTAFAVLVRKWKDIMDSGEREITSFFNKRTNCDCLKARLEVLKDCQKMGICDCCLESFELKKLMLCSHCNIIQVRQMMCMIYRISFCAPHSTLPIAKYCSEACQKSNWSKHKQRGIDAVRKEIEEGSSESMTDIMRRLSCQSLNGRITVICQVVDEEFKTFDK